MVYPVPAEYFAAREPVYRRWHRPARIVGAVCLALGLLAGARFALQGFAYAISDSRSEALPDRSLVYVSIVLVQGGAGLLVATWVRHRSVVALVAALAVTAIGGSLYSTIDWLARDNTALFSRIPVEPGATAYAPVEATLQLGEDARVGLDRRVLYHLPHAVPIASLGRGLPRAFAGWRCAPASRDVPMLCTRGKAAVMVRVSPSKASATTVTSYTAVAVTCTDSTHATRDCDAHKPTYAP